MSCTPATARRATARLDGQTGQATVEFAIALPIVVVVVLGTLQIGVTIRNELAVQLAAREGARAASVSSDPDSAAVTAATAAIDLPVLVSTDVAGRTVSVTVVHVDPTDVPIVGAVLGPVRHTATVSMRLEPP